MPRRVSLEQLERSIYIAIKVAPPHLKTGLRSKLALQSDEAARDLTKHIMSKLNIAEAVGGEPGGHHSV